MNPAQMRAVAMVSLGVLDAVEEAGTHGAPGGVLYAAMQTQGATLQQYQSVMATMVNPGYLMLDGDCYHSTEKTPELKKKLTNLLTALAS